MVKQWWSWIVVWRIWLIMVVMMAASHIAYRPDFAFTSLDFYQPAVTSQTPRWLWVWANFDGIFYLQNSTSSLLTEPRFLPLYSLLIKAASFTITPTPVVTTVQLIVSLGVAHAAFILSLIVLGRLMRLDAPPGHALGKSLTDSLKWTVIFLISFPTSFFLVSIYSESLFLLVALLSLYWARQHRWWWAGIAVGLLSVTRLPGILVLIPVAWEYWQWLKSEALENGPKKSNSSHRVIMRSLGLGALAAVPLGLLLLAHQQQFGDAWHFLRAHGELANGRSTSSIVVPLITVWRYLNILRSLPPTIYEWWVALFEICSAFFAAIMIWASWKAKLRPSYQLYSLAILALPMLSGTFTGLPRYLILAWPFYLVLAKCPRYWRWGLVLGFLLLQVVVVMAFSRGYFVA